MDLEKIFSDTFNTRCVLTEHAIKRIRERFMASEITQLKYLIQASLKKEPLSTWNNDEDTVLIDPRFNFSILCSYYPVENVVKVVTFIRGKTPEAYKNCKTIAVSILKEKADQEVAALNPRKFR